MPRITLTIAGFPDDSLTQQAASALAQLTSSALDKSLDATLVMISYFPRERWFIAGRSLNDWGHNGFNLEVTITDGTNTRQEKADYHRQAFDLLSALIGNVHPHSNIHVFDCRGDAYGYGGVTQEYHYQHSVI